jgi:monofunctional glycosyltransferase
LAVRLCVWGLALAALFYGICAVALLALNVVDPPLTMVQLQRRVAALWAGEAQPFRYQPVPMDRISVHLQHAVVAAEDTRFREHGGIDWEAVRQALEDNWRRGRVWRGGSTITQQLVKNLFLTTRSSFLRKAIEVPLAMLADLLLPKRRILELYLNVVEWGPGVFGAEAAALYHYGIPAEGVSRDQAARLAACLPNPRQRKPQAMSHYAAVIERRMRVMGW